MSVSQNDTILEIIEKRLIPDEQAKKARGEVFTPLSLVRELLYGLRKSDLDNGDLLPWGVDKTNAISADDDDDRVGGIPLELWRDPDCKWLDPANGIGNFPFVAFHMLDFQLKNHGTKGCKEWSDEKRRKHIVEKMLYMIEIDKGNVNTSFKIMDYLASGSKPNICCADTLKLKEEDLQRHFGVSKFDVIMGNPPFQKPTEGVRFGGYGGRTIWDKFVELSLDKLLPTGFLVYITPAMWRKPESSLWKPMTQDSHLLYLHIIGKQGAQQLFHVSQRIDMYIIGKSQTYTSSIVIDEKQKLNSIDTTKLSFLPNYAYDIIAPVLTTKSSGINVYYNSAYDSRKLSKTASEEYQFPVVHSMNRNGMTVLYTNDNTKLGGHFKVPKVLMSFNEQQYPYNDYKGEYGMSQITFGIPISSKEEGDEIIEAVNSESFREIIRATKWGVFQTDYKMFRYFRPDFYKQFLNKPAGGVRVTKRKESRTSSRKTRRSSSR